MNVPWSTFKTHHVVPKYLLLQYFDFDSHYMLLAFDGPLEIRCRIEKDDGADHVDFETNHKPTANKAISTRDSDGSELSRVKITKTGWHYQLHSIEFSTSKRVVDYSKNVAGTDLNFCVMKCYDASNVEITDDSLLVNAVKTVISWEPTNDFDIVGAFIFQLTIPAVDIRMWTVGVPDVPYAYGGSRPFCEGGVNMKFLGINESLKIDGRAPKTMYYSATNHTNKFALTFKHPAGTIHPMMLVFEIFKG